MQIGAAVVFIRDQRSEARHHTLHATGGEQVLIEPDTSTPVENDQPKTLRMSRRGRIVTA